jgi:hypothetical protein
LLWTLKVWFYQDLVRYFIYNAKKSFLIPHHALTNPLRRINKMREEDEKSDREIMTLKQSPPGK